MNDVKLNLGRKYLPCQFVIGIEKRCLPYVSYVFCLLHCRFASYSYNKHQCLSFFAKLFYCIWSFSSYVIQVYIRSFGYIMFLLVFRQLFRIIFLLKKINILFQHPISNVCCKYENHSPPIVRKASQHRHRSNRLCFSFQLLSSFLHISWNVK